MNEYMIFLLLSVAVASISQILLKISANKEHTSLLKEYLNGCVIGGYALMVLSTLLAIKAYSGLAFKNGPLIESLGYPIVIAFGVLFFKEKLGKKRLLGACLIVAGVIVFYL